MITVEAANSCERIPPPISWAWTRVQDTGVLTLHSTARPCSPVTRAQAQAGRLSLTSAQSSDAHPDAPQQAFSLPSIPNVLLSTTL